MSRFRQSEKREVPTLNTSALPDLIFTSLFFFMIVTHFRPVSVLTRLELPTLTELQKLEEKSSLTYIIVGHKQEKNAPGYDIQINSEFTTLEELPAALEKQKENTSPEDRGKRLAVMRIDKDAPMGLVNDLKKILREANLLTVHYSANKKTN
ncbi:MAG: biopolymer transporter ExbD [Candidatus Symbiothrix sp.]|jgi:biopolymer transport protein ExbD|nr:biopolymer transporter ExbD [Candidatus Symbiothrix sp.]